MGDVYDYASLMVRDKTGRTRRVILHSKEKTKTDIACKLLTNFIDVIQKGAQPLIDGSQVLDSIEFIDECYAAASRLGMPWYAGVEASSVA